jgi:cysteine desulfurase
MPWLTEEFGNPSSSYLEGRRAKAAIDLAREKLSNRLGCLFAEVLFTGSGTEAASMALIGAALANLDGNRRRILFSASEHHCVLHQQPILQTLGYQVELIPTDEEGVVRLDDLRAAMDDNVLIVGAMHANNELGTFNPMEEISAIVHDHGALLFTDAVQTLGTDELSSTFLNDHHVDLASFSAHKLYGPKGVGAIYIRAGTKMKPTIVGGAQEREMRAGTENVAAIVGFGAAVVQPRKSSRAAREAFDAALDHRFRRTVVNAKKLDSHLHVLMPTGDAETALIRLDRLGLSASSGAACSSGSIEPSHVLIACGYSEAEARRGLRFTFGRDNTIEESQRAASIVNQLLD